MAFTIRRHGSGFVLQHGGKDVEPRVYVRDATSGDNLLTLLAAGTVTEEYVYVDADELSLALWSELAGEEEIDVPEDLHTHGEHVGEGLILIHSHPFAYGDDHLHQIMIGRDGQPMNTPAPAADAQVGGLNPPAGSTASSAAGEPSSATPSLGLPEGGS